VAGVTTFHCNNAFMQMDALFGLVAPSKSKKKKKNQPLKNFAGWSPAQYTLFTETKIAFA